MLKPYSLHLGHNNAIDMDDLYFVKSLHDEWQPFKGGEFKHILFKCDDAERVLLFIYLGYAELVDIKDKWYYIKLRKHY